ncbi:MAG: spermidine synthase [Woeseia sp.]
MTLPRFVFPATLLISSAAIGYEILLMRLLSIVQWHHFAYMIISLALLGYGASGTFIAIARRYLEARFASAFATSALLFGVAMVACFVLGQRLPFNALEVVWNPRQFLYLAGIYLVFFVPFFFAASCIGLALTCLRFQISRIYLFDLLGAGTGAASIIGALFLMTPQNALKLLALLALAASALVISTKGRRLMLVQGIVAAVLLVGLPQSWLDLRISQFKGLSQALQVVDTRVLAQYSNALGLVTVVDSPTIPFRDAPGLSLNTNSEPPEQIAVFTDGDAMSVITRYDGDPDSLTYMDDLAAALPYQLLDEPSVLILGGGGGTDVLMALRHGAREVDVVELNPVMIRLVGESYADFAGNIYDDVRVAVHEGEARGFVARQTRRYDLIQVTLLDSFSASGSGVQSLNESYLYTVEAVKEYLGQLAPGGILAITRWLRMPPRDSLKLFATAVEALTRAGFDSPGRQLAMVRSWNTSTLLVRNGPIADEDIALIREFSRSRSFDTAYYPGMPAGEANRYNILAEPYLFDGATSLLSNDAVDFVDRYKFEITPATDNQPYFFHFFKWSSLPETLALRHRGGAGLIEWGYLILVGTLVQALVIGASLILLPLLLSKRAWSRGTGTRMGAYFFLLGLAFMFIEMAFIQKLILFLSHPLYSVAVVLSGFLVFAGTGSGYSKRLQRQIGKRKCAPITIVIAAIVVIALVYLLLLPELLGRLVGLPDVFKVSLSFIIIAPLAFFMGMPFPIGLGKVAEEAADFVPWAWGLNGYASVASTSMATLLAIEFGFTVVVMLALGLYVAAAFIIEKMPSEISISH